MRSVASGDGTGWWGRATAVLALASLAACSSGPTAPGTAPPPPPPPAANVTVADGDAQTAAPGQAVETAPEVRVTNGQGQGLPGIAVRFHVVSGGGSVANPNATTNSQGRASAGTWTLGTQAGTQRLRADVSGVGSVTFSATAAGSPPDPSVLQIVAGDGQSAQVGTALPVRPRVRVLDGDDDPIAGVSVSFAVVSGGGAVSGASAVTDGSGEAEATGWTLGTLAGENRLRAAVSGVSAVIFDAMGTAGPAASISPTAGDGQTATVGEQVPVAPSVAVADSYGNPVAGVSVTFAVASGGGSVSGGSPTTDAAGHASVGSWTLGGPPGTNALTATATGEGISGNPVGFTATGVAGGGGGFDIEIRYNPGSSPTGAQDAAYDAAVAKWEAVISGDLPDVAVARPAGTCSSPTAIDETVDDLVIFVTLEDIDGPGGVLGSAGPCLVRNGSLLPLMGSMRFDTADLATLEGNGLLDEVILHEMAHVLGVGTLWKTLGLLADPATSGGTDPYFTGSEAIDAFDDVGGGGYTGPKVPVEAGGGPGTRDGHWRESIFDKELMTGWIDAGTNPVSLVTVESLDDLGYDVDPGAADAYGLPASPSVLPGPGAAPAAIKLEGDIERRSIEVVDPTGGRIGLIRR